MPRSKKMAVGCVNTLRNPRTRTCLNLDSVGKVLLADFCDIRLPNPTTDAGLALAKYEASVSSTIGARGLCIVRRARASVYWT